MKPVRTFALYPDAQHWWSFADYGAVVDVVTELRTAKQAASDTGAVVTRGFSVIEFGPGSSTLALIEGGATQIDTCEDDPHWAAVHRARLADRFAEIVALHEYVWASKFALDLPLVPAYDLALIDGPRDMGKRLPILKWALERCEAVFMPIDQSKALAVRLDALGNSETHTVEIRETGPLAGAFALITRKGDA